MKFNFLKKITLLIEGRGLFSGIIYIFGIFLSFCRGVFYGYPLVFIGRGVVIRSRKKIKIGKFTRIEDYVELDGYGTTGLNIGSYCKIGRFSIIRVPSAPHTIGSGISIADRTTFAEFCFVGGAGMVTIGSDNSFGQYVSVHPQNHSHSNGELNSKIGGSCHTTQQGINIGSNNWIGAKSSILDCSVIGDFSTVAAMSLVRSKFKNKVLIAGIPACQKREL